MGSIFGAANISNLSTSIINPATDNPSGLTLNPSYNGTTNKNLLNPGQALTNNITSNYIKILLKFRVTNVIVGKAYTNQGQASGYVGTPANHVTVSDFTNNGPPPSIYPLGNDGFSTYSYDSDHDGIGDLDDLDEDNDGILDVDEMGICSPTSGVTSLSGFNGILYDIPNTNSWALLSGATSFPAASYTKLATFDYNELAGTNKALSINYQGDGTSLSTNPKISNFIGSNIPNDGGEDYAIYFSKTISSVEAGKYQFDLDYGDDHVFLYKNNVKVYQLQNAYGSTTNNGLASITNVATLTLNPGDVLTYVVAEENVGNTAIKFLTTKLSQVDGSAARCIVDSDNDGIPDYLDVDSDNDGCPDAVEGSENVIVDQVYPLTLALTDPNYNLRGQIKVTYDGTTTNTPPNIISNTPASLGVPQLVNNAGNNLNTVSNPSNLAGVADNTDVPGPTTADIGQGVGSSIDKTVNSCICYNLPNLTGTATGTKQGITLLKRAGADNGNWPMNRNSGLTALESNTKGFVITRLTTAQIGTLVSPQEGMMVYDTTAKCLKLYDGTAWSCFNTPTCP
ncbi:hypothetical protein [Halpernia humi]|uniref:hypothetical protein n=1 Tax=Halpernia humi TaxID=493375 RepID=UPI0011AFD41F|nr:hypothetical protein [Halpernia humi]